MSRYIDYDAIDYRNDKMHDKSSDFIDGVIYMAQRIEDAPSIDIVRCRECKYAEVYDGYYTQVCCENGVIGGHGELWDPDDFCSYGERKGE